MDKAITAALDPAAPAAERYDAAVELSAGALSNTLIPKGAVAEVIEFINRDLDEQQKSKYAGNNVVPFPSKTKKPRGMQSVYLDDFQVTAQGYYWDRPGILGFDSMRAMVDSTPILNAVILTRIRQVNRFCRLQTDGSGPGFSIKHVDKTVELGDEQNKSIQLLESFVSNCGWEFDPRARKRLRRDSFSQFMAKSVRDSLTMDACPIETEFKRNAALGLDGFYAVDGATIRLCTDEGYQGNDEIFALQVVQGQIRTAYTYDDLIYEVRNPQTSVLGCGYGVSETEMLIRIVTYLLNAMTYNGTYFDKNSIPRGIMQLSGNYSQEDLAAFKRYWTSMVRGVQNTWNVPILVSKDQESKAEFQNLNAELDEMAFSKWLSFLASIVCSIYGIAPEEISMESFSPGGKSSLSGDDTEEKLASGTDKGLRPLLDYYAATMTDFVIRPFSDQYCFRWAGLDEEDPEHAFEMRKLAITLNEARQELGYDPDTGDLGDAPLNPALLSVWQQSKLAEQQPAQDFGQAPQGDEDGAPDFGDDGGDTGDGAAPGGPPAAGGKPPGKPGGAPGDKPPIAKSFGLPALGDVYDIGR